MEKEDANMKGYFRRRGSSWSFTLDVGKDNEGNRKQKTKGGFKTKKEAEQACAELISQIHKGQYIEPSKIILRDYINDWIDSIAKQTLKITTFETYTLIIKAHILPVLGGIKLQQLTPVQIQKFYTQKVDEGLSAEYVRKIHYILSSSLKHAIRWNLLSNNPINLVEPPKLTLKEKKTWTIDEVKQFLTHTKQESLHIAYLLAIYTGMRLGEILGLRWQDCDLDQKKIYVKQIIVKTSNGLIFQEPKTKNTACTKRKTNKNWVHHTKNITSLFVQA
jgi:integrase